MANPMVPQGTLNRARGSVTIPFLPNLNVTASYLGAEGISFTPTGESVNYIGTLTGAARSPNLYMMMEGIINLVRTQPLANQYKIQMETDSNLETITVRTDSNKLSPYIYYDCSITGVDTIKINGTDVGYNVRVKGVYPVNANLFNQVPQ